MLKPWIVRTLLWVFKTGLMAGPILLVWFRCFARRQRGRLALIILFGWWATTALTGWVLKFVGTIISYTLLCAIFLALILLIDRKRPATFLLLVPLVLGVPFLGWLYSLAVEDTENPLVPVYEQRLAADLVCRGYLKWNDSMPITRLALLDRTSWFRDEVLAEMGVINLLNACPALFCLKAEFTWKYVIAMARGRSISKSLSTCCMRGNP